jgi:hypothetical protein
MIDQQEATLSPQHFEGRFEELSSGHQPRSGMTWRMVSPSNGGKPRFDAYCHASRRCNHACVYPRQYRLAMSRRRRRSTRRDWTANLLHQLKRLKPRQQHL